MADEVDELYAAPLDEFTALRNALAKRTGDGEIKRLKKPTVAAWAVNQLARRREIDLQRLLRSGEALEAAQAEAVRGGDQQPFERARRDERDSVRRLRSAAAELLKEAGHPASDQTLERVAKTLLAGAATDEGRRALREGRLGEELEPQGFDAIAALASGGASPRRRTRTKQEQRRPSEAARRRAAKAREAAEEARREADEAAAALEAAERELERARRAAARVAEKADRLEAKARDSAL